MTYDRQVNTDHATFVDEVVTKVSGMTGWSIENDQSATGHYAISTPRGDTLVVESNHLGDGSNASDDLYIVYAEDYTDASTYGWTNGYEDEHKYAGLSATDSVQYWLQYSADYGFVAYVRRNEGNNEDFSSWFGTMLYADACGTEYWDIRTASAYGRWAPHAVYGGQTGDPNGRLNTDQSWRGLSNTAASFNSKGEIRGILNPDANFSNYIWWCTVRYSSYDIEDPDTGQQPVFATLTDPLWLQDRSGTDVNTGDVVQDAGGSDEWEIVDYYNNRVAIRMI